MAMKNMSDEISPKLIACPVCKDKVSNDAKVCPHCGHPLDDHQTILGRTKGCFDNFTASFQVNAKSVSKIFLRIVMLLLRFCSWVVVAGLIGTIIARPLVNGLCSEGNYLTSILLILIYPAIVSIPVIQLAKYLVSRLFSKVLSYIYALSCTCGAIRVLDLSSATGEDALDIILQIVGVSISFLWSIYFVAYENQKKAERIIKWALIAINFFFVITYSIILILRTR